MEANILGAAIHDREAFNLLTRHDIEQSLSDQGHIIWGLLKEYYERDEGARLVDKEVLKAIIDRKFPKHSELFNGILDTLPEGSALNIIHEVIEQRKEKTSLDLIEALSNKDDNRAVDLWGSYENLIAEDLSSGDSEVIIAPDLKELFEKRDSSNRIPLYPDVLTQQLEGGPLKGHHIVLFAPTDLGKTLIALNMVRGFIEHGYKVVYVGNEDPISDLIERFLVSLTGRTKWEVRKHYNKAQALAAKKGWENLIWAPLSPGTIPEIRALVEEHKPDILVVDQIRNLDTGDKDFVRVLEKAAQAMRVFAQKYGLLSISITQAADSATGKAVLGRGDIDNSNVGIPGTADLMLGIGATEDQEFSGKRTLSFPKNKISGQKNPLEVMVNHKNMRVE